MLQNDRVGVDTANLLGVAVLSAHREIKSECVRVNDVNVARLRSSQRINSSIEGLICAHLNGNASVLAVYGDIIAGSSLVTIHVRSSEIIECGILGGIEMNWQCIFGGC